MPELPEVETIRLGLQKYLVGHRIVNVATRVSKLFIGPAKKVIGAKITGLKRIGKGLIIELDNDYVLAVHLKMTGQLIYSDNRTKNIVLSVKVGGSTLPSKYSHVIFTLDNGAFLYYNDLRQFGWVKVLKKDEVMQVPFFKEMGPEPLKDLTLEKFQKIVYESNLAIKVLLMDQKKIGGIGNIYANDALFEARIDPRRKAKTLSMAEIETLYNSILKILQKALDYGGSSDENFVNALGQEGNYQKYALVYGREGEKCRGCDGTVQKIKLGGRGTFFCSCQK
jgi:formamidopyrimidine-DNA glycosylase